MSMPSPSGRTPGAARLLPLAAVLVALAACAQNPSSGTIATPSQDGRIAPTPQTVAPSPMR